MGFASAFRADLFKDQTIIVTGGGSGIGRCAAHELASLGATVLLVGRSEDKLKTVADEIIEDGGKAAYGAVDIRDEDGVKNLVAGFVEQYGAIHGLVNNAGGQFPANLEDISSNGFMAVVKTNLLGGFLMAREVFKQSMKEHGGGIVNITADYFGGMPMMGHSGAARAGMENFTQTSAVEWSQYGVRVNAIAPGYIVSSGMDTYDPETVSQLPLLGATIPVGRMGTESEISSTICFLLSEAGCYITGSTIRVDGGSSLCLSAPLFGMKPATQNNQAFDAFHRSTLPDILKNPQGE